MEKRKGYKVIISIILIFFASAIFLFNNKEIMISSNMKKGIEKYWRDKVVIKEVEDFEVYGKKYILVLSTPIDNGKYKYLNCYEEKLNGVYYKNYQASEQGGSKAFLNFSTIYVDASDDSKKENWFTVVYGYNKDLQVDNYEMKISGHDKNVVSSIADKEYFIDAYKGLFEELVSASGKDHRDMLEAFYD